jgi:acyl carrier protein
VSDTAAPLDRDEILNIVRDRLADILEIEPSTITEGQSFVDDLEADSLALIELVEALEEQLSDRLPDFRIEDGLRPRSGDGALRTGRSEHRAVRAC